MANVIHRTTLDLVVSAHTPNFPEPTWKHDPDLTAVAGVPQYYWKAPADWDAVGAGPVEMTQVEKDAVDVTRDATLDSNNEALAVAVPDDITGMGVQMRASVKVANQRSNKLVNHILEIYGILAAIRDSSGPADNIRAQIPANGPLTPGAVGATFFAGLNTRPLPDALQDYRDEVNSGNSSRP